MDDAVAVTAPVLGAEALRRAYGGTLVVDVQRLDVRAGETLAILGPNGAGKSTLFRLLLLLERADSGTIHLRGRTVAPGDRTAATALAGVFQRPHLFSGTVGWNVGIAPRARGLPSDERDRRIDAALALVGLADLRGRDVRALSGGEAQRVAVARALAAEPAVLLLDEPTANLDVTVKLAFRQDLARATRQRNTAVVLITHDPADAFALADRVAVLETGRVVQVATPEDLVLRPATPFVAAFTGADLLLDGVVESATGGLVVLRSTGGVRIQGIATDDVVSGNAAHASYRPEDITLVPDTADRVTSAINRYRCTVRSLVTTGAMVRVGLAGELDLVALVTRQSAAALHLEPGLVVAAHLKATAVRVYRAGF